MPRRRPNDSLVNWWRRWWQPTIAAANFQRDRGQFAAAADLYAKAIRAFPARVDLRVQRANMLKDSLQFDQAEEEYLIAATRLPDDADVQLQLGHLYKVMGDRARAVERYRRAAMLSEGRPAAAQELRRFGNAEVLAEQFQSSIAGGVLERLLSVEQELRGLQSSIEAIADALPDLSAQVAFPIAQYDTMRRVWDIPPPPNNIIAPSTVVVEMDDRTHAELNGIASALRDQTWLDFQVLLLGGSDDKRRWADRIAISDDRFLLAAPTTTPAGALGVARHDLILLPGPIGLPHRHALGWFGWAARHTSATAFVCDDEGVRARPSRVDRHEPSLRQVVDHEVLLQSNPYGDMLAVDRKRLGALPLAAWAEPRDVTYALLLELSAHRAVGHIPYPLAALSQEGRGSRPAVDRSKRAQIVQRHLSALGAGGRTDVEVSDLAAVDVRVRWRATSVAAAINVVIPTRDNGGDAARLVRSLRALSAQRGNLKITLLDNGTVDPASLEDIAHIRNDGANVIRCDEPFNWSRLSNLGASSADADYVIFMNDDMLMLTPGWDDVVRGLLDRADVGLVGAKLLYPDNTIQHAGVVFGWRGRPIHEGLYEPRDAPGPGGRWQLRRRVSAVTGAFMAIKRRLFDKLGGFDLKSLAISYSDLDLCLRVRQRGLAVLYAPELELIHYESKSRGLTHLRDETAAIDEAELATMRSRWPGVLDHDISVNPAWRDATLPFRLLSAPSSDAVRRHLLATSVEDPWAPTELKDDLVTARDQGS